MPAHLYYVFGAALLYLLITGGVYVALENLQEDDDLRTAIAGFWVFVPIVLLGWTIGIAGVATWRLYLRAWRWALRSPKLGTKLPKATMIKTEKAP